MLFIERWLREKIGTPVIRLQRMFYEYGEEVDRSNGALQITFAHSVPLLLDVAGDGGTLETSLGPWVDPFGGVLSDENQVYIAEYGKWSMFDVSRDPGYAQWVGAILLDVHLLENIFGQVAGVKFAFEASCLWLYVNWDECYVDSDAEVATGVIDAALR